MQKFAISKIQNDIYVAIEPYFYEHANIFVIGTKEDCLVVDAGLGFGNLKKFLVDKGFSRIRLLLTHTHFDHAGGVKHFLPEEIIVTDSQLTNLHTPAMWGLKYLHSKDFTGNAQKVFSKNMNNFCISPPLGILAYKQSSIAVGSYSLKIIKAPGHTDDSIILFDKQKKLIITGDTLYRGSLYLDFINSFPGNIKNILKLIGSLDFNIILPGHNDLLTLYEAREIIQKQLNNPAR